LRRLLSQCHEQRCAHQTRPEYGDVRKTAAHVRRLWQRVRRISRRKTGALRERGKCGPCRDL
jgi:hypothetical protein